MAELHLVREHSLGLAGGRAMASQWVAQAQADYAMACTYSTGHDCDEIMFARSGVKGSLQVTATHFELRAQLGFLLGAFKQTIEAEIGKNLDRLLAPMSTGSTGPAASLPTP